MESRVVWGPSNHLKRTLVEVLLWRHELLLLLLLNVSIGRVGVNGSFVQQPGEGLDWLLLGELDVILLLQRFLPEVVHDRHCFVLFSWSFSINFLYYVRSIWVGHVSCSIDLTRIFLSWEYKTCSRALVLKTTYHSCLGWLEVFIIVEEVLNLFAFSVKRTRVVHHQRMRRFGTSWYCPVSVGLEDWFDLLLSVMRGDLG